MNVETIIKTLKIERFDSIPFFKEQVDSLLSNPEEIPLIIGNQKEPKQCKLQLFKPKTIDDALTVNNFYRGIQVINEELKNYKHTPNYKIIGQIFGQETFDKYDFDREFLIIHLNIGSREYSLNLKTQIGGAWTYTATSKKEIVPLNKIMDKYIGPNKP